MRITTAFHSPAALLLLAGLLSCQGRPAVVEDGGVAEPWVRVEGPGVGASWHTATLLEDGSVLLTGGSSAGGDRLEAVRFVPGENRMVGAGAMSSGHSQHAAIRLADGTVLIAAGWSKSDDPVRDTDLFDPTATVSPWSTFATTVMPVRSDPKLIQVPVGEIFLLGGIVVGAPSRAPITQPLLSGEQVERYQASTGRWEYVTDLLRSSGSGGAGIVRLTPTWVLVVGGGATEGADMRLELFDTAMLHSEFLAQTLLEGRRDPTASLLPDGRVLVVGGGFTHNMGHQTRHTAEVLDLQHGTSTLIALPHGLDHHTTTVLPDGRAVVVGGCETGPEPTRIVDQVLLLDPAAGTAKQIATLPQPLLAHTATLLADGSILIAGGTGIAGAVNVDYRFYPAVAERMQSN